MKANANLQGILGQPYPFDAVDALKRKAVQKFGEKLIDFGIGDPTDETPAEIRRKCRAAVEGWKSSGYPASIGSIEFRSAVCKWMAKRFGVSLQPDEVVATYGAKYACFHLPSYFVNPNKGEVVLITNPGYPPYTDGTLLAGGTPHYLNLLPENDFLPRFDAIEKRVAEKAKMLFLNSPNSPTGAVYPKKKLKEAVDFCNERGIVLVSDECYNELYFGEKPLSILQIQGADQCAVVLNSLSKRSMMTGYAVGFFASKNPELAKLFAAVTRKSVQGVATFIQEAAAEAWGDEKHTKKMRRVYDKRIDALLPALRHIGCEARKPAGTFYIWARVPEGNTPMLFSGRLLLEAGINTVPGNLISHESGGVNPGGRFVRFAMVQSVERTKEAAGRLMKLE
ncbi:MAG: aminotransferase class I/II-fold pyridoxal phosphate-dependent enzyme [Candidatus Diapherotrites archaeon]|nr:aminotransferase class I/II-fold pyridoxal phosphate-dependent enzyme [Candidatus Diapherotrites archaeon]